MKIVKKYQNPEGPYKGKQSRSDPDKEECLFSISDIINMDKKENVEKQVFMLYLPD